jgi:hypothetical protein
MEHMFRYIDQPTIQSRRCFDVARDIFSINCQIVADPDHKIYDVVARCPGSTHDSRIFHDSRLKRRLD